jgi:hypothetical protein
MNRTIEKDIDDILEEKNEWNQFDSTLSGLDHREKRSIEVTDDGDNENENIQELGNENQNTQELEKDTEEEKESETEEEIENETLSETSCPICHQTAHKPNQLMLER